MKKIITNPVVVISTLLFLLVALFKLFNLIPIELMFGLLGSIATLYFGLMKYEIENDRIFMELFKNFNSKYKTEYNDLFEKLKQNKNEKISENESSLIIDYFNLCAEEYLWFSKKRLPKDVWKAWKAGMMENLEIEQIKQVYFDEIKSERGRKSYYGLFDKIKLK